MVEIEIVADSELENRVSQELESLEGHRAGSFGRGRGVGQGRAQQTGIVEVMAKRCLELAFGVAQPFNPSITRWTNPCRAPSAAISSALATATLEEEPCAITTTPLEPTRWAPPYDSGSRR